MTSTLDRSPGSSGTIADRRTVRVTARRMVADGVVLLDLASAGGGSLPAWEPDAHLRMLLDNGLVRQCTLCGGTTDVSSCRIGVLDEPDGRGGSRYTTTPPSAESALGVYRPAAVPRSAVTETVVLPDGTRRTIPDSPTGPPPVAEQEAAPPVPDCPAIRVPLGQICGARSGDKGGNANVGLGTRIDAAYVWLRGFATPERLRTLIGPEVDGLDIEVFALPNLRPVNVVVHGLLGRRRALHPSRSAGQRAGGAPAQPPGRRIAGLLEGAM